MLNEFEKLKDELSVLYPGVTDIELNEMASNLVDFYTIATNVVLKGKNQKEDQETKEFVVDDENFSSQPHSNCELS